MLKKNNISERDLTNMTRGFNTPAEPEHLERLRTQARGMEQEVDKEAGEVEQSPEDPTGLRALFKQKDKNRECDDLSR